MNNSHDNPILIVEDLQTDARLIARSILKARIANPLVILTDGQQTIDYLSGEGKYADRSAYPLPALMLLDLKLPLRDGFEVLQWVRSQDGLKRLPIVVLTSSSRSPDINRAYDLGVNSYLVKPVDGEALVDIFRQLDIYWFALNKLPDLGDDNNRA